MSNPTETDTGEKKPSDNDGTSRLGKFIQTYHSFLSSFVIGLAGLIATTIWQYRQAENTTQQAKAQEDAARTQAANNWKIEKADILAKNLQVLSAQGSGNVEQRYGVLLSLTRGDILDPEVAVSYALDLGKESPEYMRSVLNNIDGKDYWRLARAYEPTCEQRYGVTRPVEICNVDKLAERSSAIAELISDEVQTFTGQGKRGPKEPLKDEHQVRAHTDPMDLLKDEHQVQAHAARLTWLFTPALINMYERRQWNEITRFESVSPGARLVTALVVASARTGELVSPQEAAQLEKFHSDHRKWLTRYMFENACDSECKGKLVEVMLTSYEESEGDYDLSMRTLIEQPRSKVGSALSHLHSRLLWCQVDGQDLEPLRDRVLVPAAVDMFKNPNSSPEIREDLVGLLGVTKAPREGAALDAWKELMSAIEKTGKYGKLLADQRADAARQRASPPAAMKKFNFCISAPSQESDTPRKASR